MSVQFLTVSMMANPGPCVLTLSLETMVYCLVRTWWIFFSDSASKYAQPNLHFPFLTTHWTDSTLLKFFLVIKNAFGLKPLKGRWDRAGRDSEVQATANGGRSPDLFLSWSPFICSSEGLHWCMVCWSSVLLELQPLLWNHSKVEVPLSPVRNPHFNFLTSCCLPWFGLETPCSLWPFDPSSTRIHGSNGKSRVLFLSPKGLRWLRWVFLYLFHGLSWTTHPASRKFRWQTHTILYLFCPVAEIDTGSPTFILIICLTDV